MDRHGVTLASHSNQNAVERSSFAEWTIRESARLFGGEVMRATCACSWSGRPSETTADLERKLLRRGA